MDKAIKAEWLTALRSGEYEQGTGMLRNGENGYCCLGVLCDIAAKRGLGEWTGYEDYYSFVDSDGTFSVSVLPDGLVKWSGVQYAGLVDGDSDKPPLSVIDGVGLHGLAEINDRGMTFAEIADIIEERF